MLAADLDAFSLQHVAQHPGAREWVLLAQLVNASQQPLIGFRRLARNVVGAAPGDVQQLGLALDTQLVDQFFTLNSPALPSAPDKRSILFSVNHRWNQAATPTAMPTEPTASVPQAIHFFLVSRAIAARAMETCRAVVAWAQR